MRNHTLNLYKITNLSDLDFSYKLVEFDLPSVDGKEDLYNKQLQKIAQKVSSVTGGPAAILKRDGKMYIAIPGDRNLREMKVDVTPFNISVKMLADVYHIQSSSITADNIDVVQKFLEFEIRRQLTNNNQLWKLNTSQFFLKKPVYSSEESTIEIFGGFTFKLVRLSDGNFYICLDLTSKYIDKHYLSHYVNETNANTVGARFRGRRFLYLNGDDWYTTEVVGFGKNIKEHEFSFDGKTHNVFDYISNKTNNHQFSAVSLVKPTDITMLYKYPGRSMEPHNGASSLAKMLYSTNDNEVKALHRYSIKDPSRRFDAIGKNINRYFQNITFNRKPLNITASPVVEQVRNFPMPELKYNNDRILKVGHYSTGASAPLREFGFERKQNIIENGVLNKSTFDEQFLIVPDYLNKELVEAFKKNAEWQIKKLAPAFVSFKVIRYKVRENQAATYQIQEIEKVLHQQNALSGFALFLLPDISFDSRRHIKNFHDCLKSKFYPGLKVQCASASKIKSFFMPFTSNSSRVMEYKVPEDKKPRFRSYLFNLVMEHLIVNRKWAFALSKNLHYDIYIGVDVHERYAGFTFFFKNGEHIFFFPEQVAKKNKSQRTEKLKAGLLYKMIYEKLKLFIPKYAANPNGIVIVRDGRSFGEEEKALSSVIESLASDGIVSKATLKSGVIDLHKQSAVPLRVASQTNSYNNLENPIAGAYKLFETTEGFIYNTGFPFQIPGTAKPLHLSLKAGDVEFLKVMEDVFCQSMMAFSAPDRSNSLPVTIKLIDTLLEPLAATVEVIEEEEEFEETTIDN
ncbi:MAG: hypothetical protein LCH58_15925 [Bacteroidetes bacterium]|uniref:hypothetical protein n=1 Tax=Phnomibacter sp. TaxID=2836217 RepID=UPI002FDDA0D2|nr:hypothetical protein [Bacteroidota bacterium]